MDVLIDDGGHDPEGQMVTLEEVLPHISPGGVFICEDIIFKGNPFNMFAFGLADELNAYVPTLDFDPTAFQAQVGSVHFYPYVVVIEKRDFPLKKLTAEKHGTQWQPISRPTVRR